VLGTPRRDRKRVPALPRDSGQGCRCPSEQAEILRRWRDRVYRSPEVNKTDGSQQVNWGRSAGSAVARELDQLRKKVKELTLRLEREAKARKLDAQLTAVAKKGREH
jgi:hypothetical protein